LNKFKKNSFSFEVTNLETEFRGKYTPKKARRAWIEAWLEGWLEGRLEAWLDT